MRMRNRGAGAHGWRAAAAVALLGVALAAPASAATPAGSETATDHGWHHRPGSPFLRALKDLDLSADQRSAVDAILKNAHPQGAARAAAPPPDFIALENPGDPNHALAVQAAQARAATQIQQRSQLAARIYDLLTAEQKASLPAALARLQARMPLHRFRHPWARPATGPV